MNAYDRPRTLADAIALLAEGQRVPVAGATDLYPTTTARALSGWLLDLTALPDLRGIERVAGHLRIGACTTWSEIAAADLPPALSAVQSAARTVGGPQIQNAGTIGGNLCNASPAADGVPPLLVLDAVVALAGPAGTRRLALAEFLYGPRRTARAPDEIVTAVLIPEAALAGRSVFLKLGARSHLVISIVMVAARLEILQGKIAQAALAVGACSPVATRLPMLEAALRGAPADPSLAARLRDADIAAALAPIDDIRADASYRTEAAATLLRRAVTDLTATAP
jgi:CO/xanthine dehydrogenase FAD-binding subunit